MWEWLVELDQQIFRYINGSYLSRFDAFWLFVTRLETWLPLYITFFILLIVKLPKRLNYIASLTVIIATLTAIGVTDLVKNAVEVKT